MKVPPLVPFAAVDEVLAAVCEQVLLLLAAVVRRRRAAALARVYVQTVLTCSIRKLLTLVNS